MKNKEFFYFGTLVAIAIINKCAGPRYFIPSVVFRLLKVDCSDDFYRYERCSRLQNERKASSYKGL